MERNNFEFSSDSVKVAKMTPSEFSIFFAGKLFYALYMFLLPSLYGVYSAGSFVSLYVASQVHNQSHIRSQKASSFEFRLLLCFSGIFYYIDESEN